MVIIEINAARVRCSRGLSRSLCCGRATRVNEATHINREQLVARPRANYIQCYTRDLDTYLPGVRVQSQVRHVFGVPVSPPRKCRLGFRLPSVTSIINAARATHYSCGFERFISRHCSSLLMQPAIRRKHDYYKLVQVSQSNSIYIYELIGTIVSHSSMSKIYYNEKYFTFFLPFANHPGGKN